MGYGSLVYRRPTGVYAFRLCVPSTLRHWFGHAEIHRSTHQHERRRALVVAARLRIGWHRVFTEVSAMDDAQAAEFSGILAGDGLIALHAVSRALGWDLHAVALELVNRGVPFYCYADSWSATACDIPLCHLPLDGGVVPYAEVEALGEQQVLTGLVRVLDIGAHVLRLSQSMETSLQPYYVQHPAWGPCFVDWRPSPPSVELSRLCVDKSSVAAWRAALAAPAGLTSAVPQPREVHPVEAVEAVFEPALVPVAPAPSAPPAPVALPLPPVAGHRFASMRLSELVKLFIAAMTVERQGQKRRWKPDEADRNRNKLMMFCELVGDPTMGELDQVPESESIAQRFLQLALRLPTGPQLAAARAAIGARPATELISWADAEHLERRMSLRTAKNAYLLKASECLRWGIAKGYLHANPCATVYGETALDESQFPATRRQPFSTEELSRIFSAPWFQTGGRPKLHNGIPSANFRPHHYWLPLLALYVGGRINELSQLYLDDFKFEAGGQPYIAFTLNMPDKLADDDEDEDEDDDDEAAWVAELGKKSLKTKNSERNVPVHPELIRLGLLQYVEALRSGGHVRLFEELRFDSKKGYGADARKWFNDRFLGKTLKGTS